MAQKLVTSWQFEPKTPAMPATKPYYIATKTSPDHNAHALDF